MGFVTELVTKYFGVSNGELIIGGERVTSLIAQFGTPLFVYDSHILDHKFNILRETLPEEFEIYYSIKANPHPAFLKHFIAKGCGLEVASGGEFQLALLAGCSPQRILFAGPGKTEAELELALAHQIGEIHVESIREVERISSIGRRLGVRARIAVRVNPRGEAQGGAMRMGAKATPFGVDEEGLNIVLDRILSDGSFEFRGIHLYIGTQVLDHTILIGQYRRGLEIVKRVATRLKRPVSIVDFGGGFGIPYFSNEKELDMEKFREDLILLMKEIKMEALFEGTQFVVEPGRYLVGEAGVYITCINDIKISHGKKFLITDGGMNHHLAASGNLGQVIKRNFPVAALNKLDIQPGETVDIAGPLCTPLDVLAREINLPVVEVGDIVGVFQSGAYARTSSPLGFLSHLTPAEVWIESDSTRLIRRRGNYRDLFYDLCLEP